MASDTESKVILLAGMPQQYEAVTAASEAILPGHLVNLNSAGALIKHATDAGLSGKTFASIDSYAGGSIAVAYSDGETAPYYACAPGDEIYAILEDGHAVAIGDFLESAGDGTLQPVSGNFPVCQAIEAVTTSGSTARIRVRVV